MGGRGARLAAELGLHEERDVFEVKGMLGMRDLWDLVKLDLPKLKDPPHQPVDHPTLQSTRSIFHIIREAKAILLQHPYESFSSSVSWFASRRLRKLSTTRRAI